MSVPRPTVYPTVWPPRYTATTDEIRNVAAYLNEPILEQRAKIQADRAAAGKPPATEAELVYYPLFPHDGWSTRTDVGSFRMIGPLGIAGFGQHEFPGDPDQPIRRRINEMQALASGVPYTPPVQPPAPPVVDPPPPPPVVDPPPVNIQCPAGQYFNSFTNRCESVVTLPADHWFRVGPIRVKLDVFDERLQRVEFGIPVDLGGGTVGFRFSPEGSLQVFATVLDGRPVNGKWWVMSCGLTDVACGLEAVHDDGRVMEYNNSQGDTFPTTLDTGAF